MLSLIAIGKRNMEFEFLRKRDPLSQTSTSHESSWEREGEVDREIEEKNGEGEHRKKVVERREKMQSKTQ